MAGSGNPLQFRGVQGKPTLRFLRPSSQSALSLPNPGSLARALLRAGSIGFAGRRNGVRIGRGSAPRCRSRCVGRGGHGAFWIEQVIFARAQAQFDERTRIGNFFGLPTVVALVAAHGIFAGLVPGVGGLAAQVTFTNQGFLNGAGSFRVDFLLPTRPDRLLLPGRMLCGGGGVRGGGVSCAGWLRRARRRRRGLMMLAGASLGRGQFLIGRIGGGGLRPRARRWNPGARQDQRTNRTVSHSPRCGHALSHQCRAFRTTELVPAKIARKNKKPNRTVAL